jgi:hypothetical protein
VREQRAQALDHLAPVGLERVGGVVVPVAEERADAEVDDPVRQQLEQRAFARTVAPTMPKNSPGCTLKLISSTAFSSSNVRVLKGCNARSLNVE